MTGVLGAVIFGTVIAGASGTKDDGGGSVVLGDDGGCGCHGGGDARSRRSAIRTALPAASSSRGTERRSAVSSIVELGAEVVSTAAIVDSVDDAASTSAPAGPTPSSPAVAAAAALPARNLDSVRRRAASRESACVGGVTMVPSTSGRGLAISTEVGGRGLPIVAIAATAAMTPAPTRKPRGVCTG